MKLNVKVSRGRGSKESRSESVNIDLYSPKEILLGRLIFKENPNRPGKYVLGEDFFFRSDRLEIQTYARQEQVPLKEIVGKKQEAKRADAIHCIFNHDHSENHGRNCEWHD